MTNPNVAQHHDAPGVPAPEPDSGPRPGYFEIWTRTVDGKLRKHGAAHGRTFRDACKHLACTSLDFWTHYDRDRYQGQHLYPSREAASRGLLLPDE